MRLNLVVLTAGKWQGRRIPVNRLPFLIGRDPACQLRPATPLVSNRHCALSARGGNLYVRDLGSTNGTFLNGQKVTGERALHRHDSLRIGPVEFDICIGARPSISQPTPLPPTRGAKTPAREEEVAALLLSIEDFGNPSPGIPSADSDGVPTGRTTTDTRLANHVESEEPKGEGADLAHPWNTDAPAVAAELLQRYLRRAK